jgi:aminopeptidase N
VSDILSIPDLGAPALLAGDRSLVDVVVHELTHSWFGNGIT